MRRIVPLVHGHAGSNPCTVPRANARALTTALAQAYASTDGDTFTSSDIQTVARALAAPRTRTHGASDAHADVQANGRPIAAAHTSTDAAADAVQREAHPRTYILRGSGLHVPHRHQRQLGLLQGRILPELPVRARVRPLV